MLTASRSCPFDISADITASAPGLARRRACPMNGSIFASSNRPEAIACERRSASSFSGTKPENPSLGLIGQVRLYEEARKDFLKRFGVG